MGQVGQNIGNCRNNFYCSGRTDKNVIGKPYTTRPMLGMLIFPNLWEGVPYVSLIFLFPHISGEWVPLAVAADDGTFGQGAGKFL